MELKTPTMLEFAQKLHEELLQKLEALDKTQDHEKMIPDQRLQLLTTVIDQLKQNLRVYQFERAEEEIHFFKSILPLFLSEFIYYSEIVAVECSERIGTEKSRLDFLEKEFEKFDYFFKVNDEFFNYFRFGKTKFDRYYFLRDFSYYHEDLDLPAFMLDSSFCTIYSWKLAMIIAYNRLEKEIRFNTVKTGQSGLVGAAGEESFGGPNAAPLRWTDPKMGLVELIYSLNEQGSFNHGNTDIKTITRYFERVFAVQLSNTSKSFQDLLCRKKGYTTYIDKLREKINGRIDDIEEGHIR